MDEVEQDTSGFLPLVGITEISGFMAVVLMGIWMGHFRKGFAWSENPDLQFNWHPLLMTLGMIYLYGNGILLYRVFRHERKKKLKLAHAIIMISSFLLTVIGLKAVFDSHNLKKDADGNPAPIANLYSLHSWMGIIAVILFAFQWLAGFITFLFPGLASHLRASYMPIHTSFGILIFVLGCATALLGITEKLIFALKTYSKRDPEGVMANWIGVLIIVFGVLVVYLATNYKYKRMPRPEDEMLLNETHANLE